MWTTFTEASMNPWAHQLFMPLVLIVNYTLCEYLLTIYWSRRKERRIRLLFVISLLGVVCLVPFANEDEDLVRGLNDVSESCVVVTFLIQITVIGYDVNAKFKIRSVMYLTYVAELLIVVDLAAILLSAAFTFVPSRINHRLAKDVPNVCENITLAFIFGFRFYYIGISRGWRSIWRHQKLEFACYLLFSLHEMPFAILEDVSGLSWEHPQALWNRVTIAACLVLTARGKLRGASSRGSHAPTSGRVTKTSRRESARSSVYASAGHLTKKRLSTTSSTVGITKVAIQQHSTRSGRITTDDSGMWSKGQSFTNQSPIVVVADAPLEVQP